MSSKNAVRTHEETTVSHETVTRRGYRGLGGWWWLALLLAPLLLMLFATVVNRGGIEEDLKSRTLHSLRAGGINVTDDQVTFVGRDGSINAPGIDAEKAKAIALAENGVRVVDITTDGAAPVATADSPSASGSASATAAGLGQFKVQRTPAGLVVTGTTAGPSEDARILADVRSANPGVAVTGTFTHVAGSPSPTQVAALSKAVTAPGVVLVSTGKDIVLTGEVATEAIKKTIGDAVVAAAGPGVRVENMLIAKTGNAPVVAGKVEDCPKLNADIATALKANPLRFVTGSAQLDAGSQKVLQLIAAKLKPCVGAGGGFTSIDIAGHTDNVGDAANNKTLSDSRAAAVKQALVTGGVPADKVKSAGFGATKPIADNGTEAGRAQNRRVDIVLK